MTACPDSIRTNREAALWIEYWRGQCCCGPKRIMTLLTSHGLLGDITELDVRSYLRKWIGDDESIWKRIGG